MRNGQKRMRGRNNNNPHRKSQNPLTRVYESNGPDVKIRGTASHIAEKYIQLARDSQSSGDPVAAENYYQHAEHYFRLIAVAQEQFRQQNPYYNAQPQNQGGNVAVAAPNALPAFITGGGQPQPNPAPNANQGYGQNGNEQGDRQDRFGHRRRRRHRGGGYRPDRPDNFGNANPQGAAPQPNTGDGGDEPPAQAE